jgi:predicted transcriptional regulator
VDPDERAELEEEIEAGFGDLESGNVVDARELLAQLRAKNARESNYSRRAE